MCGLVRSIVRGLPLGLIVGLIIHSAALADCKQWGVSGVWGISQNNGFIVQFGLSQSGSNEISGRAQYYPKSGGLGSDSKTLSGTIDTFGNMRVTIEWQTGAVGIYTFGLGSDGQWAGIVQDRDNPGSATTFAVASSPAKCLVEASTGTAPAAPSTTPAAKCPPGLVWRDTFNGDTVCVTPEERDKAKFGGKVLRIGKSPSGGRSEYVVAVNPTTIYQEPGGAAFTDAQGNDIGISAGTKALVLDKRTDPAVWYKVLTKPVGWVWGEDVKLAP
jgi:hypothetical protein